jgi:multidrug efflux pump subunit AcrA (membrane-fusion protein)
MARSTLFDRLNQELEAFGKKAQAALDEGKLQIEQMRVRRRRDNAARDLGLLIHRRERGTEVEPRRVEALLVRLDDLEAELGRLQRQLDEARRNRPTGARRPPASGPGEAAPSSSAEPSQPAAGATA